MTHGKSPSPAFDGEWPADKVERWPIDKLTPNPRNARKHSAKQIKLLAEAIKQWGITTAVLVDEAGSILAGHGRVLAAKKLGLPEIPVMVARNWTLEQKRAYLIADNQHGLNSEWDEEMLGEELGALQAADFAVDLIGFDAEELDGLLPDADEKPGDSVERSAGRTTKAVIQFNIVFDDEMQQESWFSFVRALKAKYPNAETLGARLALFTASREYPGGSSEAAAA
jgi:hypothetical protein